MDVVLTVVLVLLVLLGAVALALFIGFKRRSPWALDGMRWMTKLIFNPVQMRTAGRPGSFAGVIEHRGRVSGTTYRTPVGIRPTDDGFVIVLPYDTRPDWVKNVLAAGTATLSYEDETFEVDRPEVLPISWGMPYLTEKEQRRIGAVTQCLRLRNVDAP
jgi:deazaflavin-dependent oxidoreductase (nitroreductase family)